MESDSDNIKKSEKSFSRVLISGAGFLADAYDLFVINIAVDIMDRANYVQPLTDDIKSTIKSMALAGAIVGQLGFGSIADLVGRRKVFITTCSLVIIGALLSSAAVNTSYSFGIYSQLCLWRFVLGVGVGGEYPLSASVTSESSTEQDQVQNLAMVFSMQGIGALLCSLVLVILTNSMGDNYDAQWRIALGLGALPMAIAFYFRWKMHETAWKEEAHPPELEQDPDSLLDAVSLSKANKYSNNKSYSKINGNNDSNNNDNNNNNSSNNNYNNNNNSINHTTSHSHSNTRIQHKRQSSQVHKVIIYFLAGTSYVWETVKSHRLELLGTAGAWLILDIVFYANGLFSGQVTKAMGFGTDPKEEATASFILQGLALPGYICSIFFAERLGLRKLQIIGFIITAFFFFLLSILQPYLLQVPILYVILYGCTFFWQNFGANTTTYIIPSLLYPTAHRATCHGISSAAGKLGALIGAQVFLYLVGSFCSGDSCSDQSSQHSINAGLRITFFVCGALAVIGGLWSVYLVKDVSTTIATISDTNIELHADSDSIDSIEGQHDNVNSSHGILSDNSHYNDEGIVMNPIGIIE